MKRHVHRESGWCARKHSGFTLAELLISLAILGLIATFVIPKILYVSQDAQKKTMAKETAAMLSGAWQTYRLKSPEWPDYTTIGELLPYMNYVGVADTSLQIDNFNQAASTGCGSPYVCLKLHNGGILQYHQGLYFGCETALCAIPVLFDPDGVYGGSGTGPSKSVVFWIYYDGKIRSEGTLEEGTHVNGSGTRSPTPSYDPEWFSWN